MSPPTVMPVTRSPFLRMAPPPIKPTPVIEPGDQMRGAGARGCDADAQASGKLGVGRRHERGHFLVSGLDELDFSIGAIEGAKHTVNAVARIAEDMVDTPVVKTLDEKIAYGLGHGILQISKRCSANKREAGGVRTRRCRSGDPPEFPGAARATCTGRLVARAPR